MKADYSEEYYDVLNIIDRLREECVNQYGTLYKAAKAFGSRHLNKYLNANAYSLGLKNLMKICKFLNISLEYALNGGVKENYQEQIPTFNNFYRIYKDIYKGEVDHQVYIDCWLVRKGRRTTIPLKYLIKIAKRSKKTLDFLIGG